LLAYNSREIKVKSDGRRRRQDFKDGMVGRAGRKELQAR
jgi:hypothetical protein